MGMEGSDEPPLLIYTLPRMPPPYKIHTLTLPSSYSSPSSKILPSSSPFPHSHQPQAR